MRPLSAFPKGAGAPARPVRRVPGVVHFAQILIRIFVQLAYCNFPGIVVK